MKITEYARTTKVSDTDVLLIDGVKIVGGLVVSICASEVAEAVLEAVLPAPVNLVGKSVLRFWDLLLVQL